MKELNYHHLYYFWMVAKEGSISSSSRKLNLAQPTISAQIKSLENSLGCKLFHRQGKRLVLTEIGRWAFQRADEIFALGQDLVIALNERRVKAPRLRLHVGITDTFPKLLAYRLLEPATKISQPVLLICQQDKQSNLLARLAVYELDLVITEEPINPHAYVRAHNHFLGECGVSVFVAASASDHYRRDFPKSLTGASFLLPPENTSLRRSVNVWFDRNNILPNISGEFNDSTLIKVFGQAGLGLFFMPTVEEPEILHQYKVKVVGRLPQVRERYYAVSTERKLKNPAVLAITEFAHRRLFE